MRSADAPASMGELMGSVSEGKKLSLEDLPEVLGENMQHIPISRVGRVRLIHALQQRFGDGFHNRPGVRDILDHFDKELATERVVRKNVEARNA